MKKVSISIAENIVKKMETRPDQARSFNLYYREKIGDPAPYETEN